MYSNYFDKKPQQNIDILELLRRSNPEQVMQQLMRENPKFREFVNENKGLSVEQILSKYRK